MHEKLRTQNKNQLGDIVANNKIVYCRTKVFFHKKPKLLVARIFRNKSSFCNESSAFENA